MHFMDIMNYILLIYALSATGFIAFGIKMLLSKQPIIINERVNLVIFSILTLLVLIPLAVNTIKLDYFLNLYIVFLLVVIIAMQIYSWFQFTGYRVIGINIELLQQALYDTLNKNGYQFKEKLIFIELSDSKIKLRVRKKSRAVHLKFINSKERTILKNIVAGIATYYKNNGYKPDYLYSTSYMAIGLLFIAIAIFLNNETTALVH